MLRKRAIKFAKKGAWKQIFWEAASDDEIVQRIQEDESLFELFIESYKQKVWRKFNKQRKVGQLPCTSLQELERVSRLADEKFLVMCGWHHPAGGIRGFCAYCNIEIDLHEMTIDHLVPKSGGGTEELENLIPACPECNYEKGSLTAGEYLALLGMSEDQVTQWHESVVEAMEFRNNAGFVWTPRMSEHQKQRLGISSQVSDLQGRTKGTVS